MPDIAIKIHKNDTHEYRVKCPICEEVCVVDFPIAAIHCTKCNAKILIHYSKAKDYACPKCDYEFNWDWKVNPTKICPGCNAVLCLDNGKVGFHISQPSYAFCANCNTDFQINGSEETVTCTNCQKDFHNPHIKQCPKCKASINMLYVSMPDQFLCSHCMTPLTLELDQLKVRMAKLKPYDHPDCPEGKKFDENKLRWDLFPAEAAEEIIKVLMFGAKKYDDWNWAKGIKFSRLFAAIMRHLWAWWRGETNDPETNLNHLAHVGCCIVFLLSYSNRADYVQQFDDRPPYYFKQVVKKEVKKDA